MCRNHTDRCDSEIMLCPFSRAGYSSLSSPRSRAARNAVGIACLCLILLCEMRAHGIGFSDFKPAENVNEDRMNDLERLYERKGQEDIRRIADAKNQEIYARQLEKMRETAKQQDRYLKERQQIVGETALGFMEAFGNPKYNSKISAEQRAAALPTLAKCADILAEHQSALSGETVVDAVEALKNGAQRARESSIKMTDETARKYAEIPINALEIAGKKIEQLKKQGLSIPAKLNEARADLLKLTPDIAKNLDFKRLGIFVDEGFKYFNDTAKPDNWKSHETGMAPIDQLIESTAQIKIEDRLAILSDIRKQIGDLSKKSDKQSTTSRFLKTEKTLEPLNNALKNLPVQEISTMLGTKGGKETFRNLIKDGFGGDAVATGLLLSKAVEALGNKPERVVQEILLEGKAAKDIKAKEVKDLLDVYKKIDSALEIEKNAEVQSKFESLKKQINATWNSFPKEELLSGFIESGDSEIYLNFVIAFAKSDGKGTAELVSTVFERYKNKSDAHATLDAVMQELFIRLKIDSDKFNNKKDLLDFIVRVTDLLDVPQLKRLGAFNVAIETARSQILADTVKDLGMQEKEIVFNSDMRFLKKLERAYQEENNNEVKFQLASTAQNAWKPAVKSEWFSQSTKPEDFQAIFDTSSIIFKAENAEMLYENFNPTLEKSVDEVYKANKENYKKVMNRRLGFIGLDDKEINERPGMIDFLTDALADSVKKNVSLKNIENLITIVENKGKETLIERSDKKYKGQAETAKRGLSFLKARLELMKALQEKKINTVKPEVLEDAFRDLTDKNFDIFMQKVLDSKPSPEVINRLTEITRKNLEPIEKSEEAKKIFAEKGYLTPRRELLEDLVVKDEIGDIKITDLTNQSEVNNVLGKLNDLFKKIELGDVSLSSAAFRRIIESVSPQLFAQMTEDQITQLYNAGEKITTISDEASLKMRVNILDLLTQRISSIFEKKLTTAHVTYGKLLEKHATALEAINTPEIFKKISESKEIKTFADSVIKLTELLITAKKDLPALNTSIKTLQSVSEAIHVATVSKVRSILELIYLYLFAGEPGTSVRKAAYEKKDAYEKIKQQVKEAKASYDELKKSVAPGAKEGQLVPGIDVIFDSAELQAMEKAAEELMKRE